MSNIRTATLADVPDIAAMLGAWNRETFGMPLLHPPVEEMQLAKHLITRRTTRVLCKRNILGFLSRTGHQLEALYLIPAARGQRLGHLLLNEAKAACADLTVFTFQANLPAQRLFARAGFVEMGRGISARTADHLPDLRLRWQKEQP